MRSRTITGFKIVLLTALSAMAMVSCSLLFGGGEDDMEKKSASDKFAEPSEPYRRINVTSADAVWQSMRTGNTIALNSICSKSEEKRSLETLESSILSGIEKMQIHSKNVITLDGAPADRTLADGLTEGVPIEIDLVTIHKGDCVYDLAYVARKQTFAQEHGQFDNFVKGFKLP